MRPAHSLIDGSFHSELGAEATNADGFGLGWKPCPLGRRVRAAPAAPVNPTALVATSGPAAGR